MVDIHPIIPMEIDGIRIQDMSLHDKILRSISKMYKIIHAKILDVNVPTGKTSVIVLNDARRIRIHVPMGATIIAKAAIFKLLFFVMLIQRMQAMFAAIKKVKAGRSETNRVHMYLRNNILGLE